jgi:exodeoxyribonuclease VII large subunit
MHDGAVSKAPPPSLPFDLSAVDTIVGGGRYRETTITRLCGDLARAFSSLGEVLVHGEVANAKGYDGRVTYLTLRDRSFEIPVYVPASRAKYCLCKNGEAVAIAGKIELVPKRAQLQLVAHEIAPVGAGAIAAKVELTRQRLTADGLVGRPRKRVPMLPRAIGVVCGNDAAVRKDIESVIASRFPGYPIEFCEVTVQGPGAVESIIWALTTLQARPIDVIVLARGGGDASQLLPFSDEEVCRAICASKIPVVSAIGHDGDKPLSDDVADLRAGTPSIAAAMVVPSRVELVMHLDTRLHDVERLAVRSIERAAGRLAAVQWVNVLNHRLEREAERLQRFDAQTVFDRQILRAQTELGSIDWRSPIRRRVERESAGLAAASVQLEALSPMRVLERGYAVVRRSDGSVVRNGTDVSIDESISITVARGVVGAVVTAATNVSGELGEHRV